MSPKSHPFFPCLAFAALALLVTIPCAAQENNRRLILKDGSYQLITKYEVNGDRVRYYSVEREDWEEIPKSLVDWPATEKYERDTAASKANVPEAVQLDNEAGAELENAIEVAPGLHLTEGSGVFLLDNYQGEPQLDEINQTAGDVSHQGKGNILRGLGGVKQTIELDRAHATIQSHVAVPSFYIRNPDDDAPAPFEKAPVSTDAKPTAQQPPLTDRFRILRLEAKGNKRVVGEVKRDATGKINQDQKIIKTTANTLNGGWLKLTPIEPMPAGEYAVVEMLGKEGMNLYVWDFGIDPKAAANPNPWRPDTKPPEPAPANPQQ